VPMLLSWRKPDHISGVNLLDRVAFSLSPSAACSDNQGLSEGMGMPGGAGTWLKGDAGTGNKGWIGRLKEGVDAYGAGKPLRWAFA